MNANANTEEKYAWVDALLENCALQEQRDYEEQDQDQDQEEEANPEWNEDEAEDDYMEHCEHCNAGFDTDRQLAYHQMVCMPGNNELCADFLDRPPPLTRQNCCFLTEVVDELTGDISLVEVDAYGRMEVDEPDEELIADENMEEDDEEQDLVLYNIKRYNELTFAPFKRHKTHHEHPIPEPMDICNSDEEDAVDDYMSENDKLEPRQLFNDDDEEEEDLLSVMSDITVEALDEDDEDEYLNNIWILEQEAHRRFPRRAQAQAADPHADLIFPVFDDNNGNIAPIPMEVEDQMLDLGPDPSFQRQTTFWVDPQINEIVYNGNPNGSRLFEDEDDDLNHDYDNRT